MRTAKMKGPDRGAESRFSYPPQTHVDTARTSRDSDPDFGLGLHAEMFEKGA